MRIVVDALAEQHRELDDALTGLGPGGWERPSRCPGWTVTDVVLHLAQTDELATANVRDPGARDGWDGGTDVDQRVAEAVDRERGAPGPDVYRRWRTASWTMRAALAACDPRRPVPWAVGSLPARTLATTRLAEAWIHTGDVLDGLGEPQPPAGRLWHIARLAWRTLPYAFTRAGHQPSGPVAVELLAPDGSTWTFAPQDDAPATVVRGAADDFCLVAGRRRDPADSGLSAEGPDADAVLRLVRTFA